MTIILITRAKLVNPKVFENMTQVLEKLSKKWILRLSQDNVYFIVSKQEIDKGVQVYAQLDSNVLFDDYVVESAAQNEIYLELFGSDLKKALASASSSADATIKLTKNALNLPLLVFTCPGILPKLIPTRFFWNRNKARSSCPCSLSIASFRYSRTNDANCKCEYHTSSDPFLSSYH